LGIIQARSWNIHHWMSSENSPDLPNTPLLKT
jgi:hypothetical protein